MREGYSLVRFCCFGVTIGCIVHLPLLQVESIISNTHELKERQETPDSPEALQCVPTLQLTDIPKTITKV